jgi:ADP-heptose:LPS heptosyltransferase
MNKNKQICHSFLLLLPAGIGDAVMIGLSSIDQIIKNDPKSLGKIDVVCNDVQAEIFKADPRIRHIIRVSPSIFPTPDIKTWMKAVILKAEARDLLPILHCQRYEAVFPGNTTPFFYMQIRSRIIRIYSLKVLKDFIALLRHAEIPYSQIVRQIINAHFGNILPEPSIGEKIPLYIGPQDIQKAIIEVQSIKERSGVPAKSCRLMVVAPDTSSAVTRPPTELLAIGIADAMARNPHLIVLILPGYTDQHAAENLYHALWARFGSRIHIKLSRPRPTLLEITALIDQADVFVTGDTGVMHLAVTRKKVHEDENMQILPRNATKIIALFGGTNPGLFGYSKQSIILGRGRKEQVKLIPGIFKEAYYYKNQHLFEHISPQLLAETIIDQFKACSNTPVC